MKIALASKSQKKIDAVRLAFGGKAEILAFKAPSGVNEQPIGDETLQGAQNRIAFIREACPDADLYVSIENGLFEENGDFVDKAVVTLSTRDGKTSTTYSDGVTFPKEFVIQTRDRDGGFKQWTVGKTMAEAGHVSDDGDPHKDLAGRSRVSFLNEAARRAARQFRM